MPFETFFSGRLKVRVTLEGQMIQNGHKLSMSRP